MARPPDADSARTYEKIVQAGQRCLEEEGGELPSLRTVAKRAGVGVGTVQYYFETKEALMDACLDAHYARMEAVIAPFMQLLEASPDPLLVIEQVVRLGYRFALGQREVLRARNAADLVRGHLHPRRLSHTHEPLMRRGSEVLARRLGGEPLAHRQSVQSLVFLIAKHVLYAEEDLRTSWGHPTAGPDEVEAHLVTVARALFAPRAPVEGSHNASELAAAEGEDRDG